MNANFIYCNLHTHRIIQTGEPRRIHSCTSNTSPSILSCTKAPIFWHRIQVVAVPIRRRGCAARRRHPAKPRVAATLLARYRPAYSQLAQFAIAAAVVVRN